VGGAARARRPREGRRRVGEAGDERQERRTVREVVLGLDDDDLGREVGDPVGDEGVVDPEEDEVREERAVAEVAVVPRQRPLLPLGGPQERRARVPGARRADPARVAARVGLEGRAAVGAEEEVERRVRPPDDPRLDEVREVRRDLRERRP
jgi:hypothetical protein